MTLAEAKSIDVQAGADLAAIIERSTSGDRLVLSAGIYEGGLLIDKPLTIVGAGIDNTTVHVRGTGKGSVITIDAPNVVVSNLTISGSGDSHETIDSGVQLTERATAARIIGNHLEGNLHGIDIHGPRDALAKDNIIIGRRDRRMNSRGNGVYIWNAPGATVEGNTVRYGRDGIFVNTSRENEFRANRFYDLRFAVHYMYADNSRVADNYSEGNHLGFAIMFSTNVEIINNVSVDDRDHGIMLNYANESIVQGNSVIRGRKKCLFMYNANKNSVTGNHFEGCQIGIHFTGGSERNTVAGNAFVGNRRQVKYVGSRYHAWPNNYWSDHVAYDMNGDGFADQPFRPNDNLDQILWTQPAARLLLGSPALQLVRWAQREFPTLLPGGVTDLQPLMKPTTIGDSL